MSVQCRDGSSTLINGVLYGRACAENPPCGKRMALVPPPQSCGHRLPDALMLGDPTPAATGGAATTGGAEASGGAGRLRSMLGLGTRRRQEGHGVCSAQQADLVAQGRLQRRRGAPLGKAAGSKAAGGKAGGKGKRSKLGGAFVGAKARVQAVMQKLRTAQEKHAEVDAKVRAAC